MVLWLVTPASEGQKSNPKLVLWRERINLDEEPCRTIAAENVAGLGRYHLEEDGAPMRKKDDRKPVYRVPSMPETRAVPQTGLTLVSTFSGCGGSCLGFRMAGFETLWASEFIPAARQVYELNHPGIPIDTRDIRDVQPEEILAAIGKKKGEIDVLEGSPPCASFSTAGKREKRWGQVVKYSETTQRVDDLFFEFVRILKGLQPRVFIAENVSGLVKGKAKGYFKEVLAAMKAAGYKVRARLLDAQWLGVPQTRQRVIFVGVRADLGVQPAYPAPLGYRYSVSEALPWIIKVNLMKHGPNSFDVPDDMERTPAATVGTGPESGTYSRHDVMRAVHSEGGEWDQGDVTEKPAPTVKANRAATLFLERSGHGYFEGEPVNLSENPAPTVPTGPSLSGYNEHNLRVVEPEADISRFAIGEEWDKLEPGEQSKKYFSLKRAHPDEPSPCVTQSAGTAWSPAAAAGVTHPTERRKFSIAELKRICAFPDDFELTGSYSQQWERLGRAVPPVMAFWIARAVRELLFGLDGRDSWPHDPPCLVEGLGYERS